jgi:hypothetical protein
LWEEELEEEQLPSKPQEALVQRQARGTVVEEEGGRGPMEHSREAVCFLIKF